MSNDAKYQQKLQELYQLEFFGMKLGLQNITALLEFLGRPDRIYPTIHVAGTNGKGSVSSTLAAIFQAAGFKTGLYTSPHLIEFRERIKVSGEMMPQEFMIEFAERLWPKVEEIKATFFETTTAMAFEYFSSQKVDIAIIETGLGGRLDSTNVLEKPLATVVTSIGWDHMAQLGNTLELIAAEKAGIFKKDVPAVVHVQPQLKHAFRERAFEVGTNVLFVDEYQVPATLGGVRPSLRGEFQARNLRTVLAALSVLPMEFSPALIEEAVIRTNELTGLRGRLEAFATPQMRLNGINMILEVGHNPDAIREVVNFVDMNGIRPIIVTGVMKDKDIPPMLQALRKISDRIITVQAHTHRAMDAQELKKLAIEAGFEATSAESVSAGVEEATAIAQPGDTILLVGSHYIVGEFLANLPPEDRVWGG